MKNLISKIKSYQVDHMPPTSADHGIKSKLILLPYIITLLN